MVWRIGSEYSNGCSGNKGTSDCIVFSLRERHSFLQTRVLIYFSLIISNHGCRVSRQNLRWYVCLKSFLIRLILLISITKKLNATRRIRWEQTGGWEGESKDIQLDTRDIRVRGNDTLYLTEHGDVGMERIGLGREGTGPSQTKASSPHLMDAVDSLLRSIRIPQPVRGHWTQIWRKMAITQSYRVLLKTSNNVRFSQHNRRLFQRAK